MTDTAEVVPSARELDAFIAKYALTAEFKLVEMHAVDREGEWEHDRWQVTIKRGRVAELVDYMTGIGNRVQLERHPYGVSWESLHVGHVVRGLNPAKYPGGCVYKGALGIAYAAKPPTLADVLECLRLDSGALEQTFPDWAVEVGFSSDSIRARNTWEACLANGAKLLRLVGLDGLHELRSLDPL